MALRPHRNSCLGPSAVMLGYAIGALLFDTVGQWLINLYGYGAKIDALENRPRPGGGWLVILVKGLTPIPYKLVTIVSGLLEL